jgi:hypothetical protein
MSLIHRVRAGIVIGLSWSLPWAAAGVALMTWRVFLGAPRLADPLHYWPRFALTSALTLGAFGFVAGVAFAISLGTRARGRALDDLSGAYAARWGALAGAASIVVAPLIGLTVWPVLLAGSALFALVGAGSAAMTLGLARRSGVHRPLASPPPATGDGAAVTVRDDG